MPDFNSVLPMVALYANHVKSQYLTWVPKNTVNKIIITIQL